MRVQQIMQVCNEQNSINRSMCLLRKLYQWAINASKNIQEDSNDRCILKHAVLALHLLTSKHRYYTTLHLKTLFTLYSGCNQTFANGVSLLTSKNVLIITQQKNITVKRMTHKKQNGYHFWFQIYRNITPFSNFWLYNFNLKSLIRNHPRAPAA